MKFKKIKFPKISLKTKNRIKFSFAFFLGIFLLSFFAVSQFPLTGKIIETEGYKIVPLNSQDRNLVEQSILSSEFVKELPQNDPVFLRFFSFENGERVWQDGFLVGKDGILVQGEPTIYFSIHAKYISELNTKDLCSIVKDASKNGDIAVHSDYNKIRLFLKYAHMIKYQNCFEF
jgi:hypothetical protein